MRWAKGMGRLDAKAVPALIAVLDSPDPAIAAYFAELARLAHPQLVLLRNENNLGFTGTANRGMQLSGAVLALLAWFWKPLNAYAMAPGRKARVRCARCGKGEELRKPWTARHSWAAVPWAFLSGSWCCRSSSGDGGTSGS